MAFARVLGWVVRCLATVGVALLASYPAKGQDLEPRLYQNAPVGLNAIVLGYGFSSGNVLFDTALLIEDATADVHVVLFAYLRTFDFFGRSAKFDVVLPFSDANFQGLLDGVFRTRNPTGMADPRFRLAVNLVGSPPLSAPEFRNYRQKTIVGASLQVAVPLGQYDPTKLINLGANRWSFRPEIGVSRSLRRWFLEMAAGGWFFTTNNDFFGGATFEQNALLFIKGDAIQFSPRSLAFLQFRDRQRRRDDGQWRVRGEPAAELENRVDPVDPYRASQFAENCLYGGTLDPARC